MFLKIHVERYSLPPPYSTSCPSFRMKIFTWWPGFRCLRNALGMWPRCILGKPGESFWSLMQGGNGSLWACQGSVPSACSQVLLGNWCRTSCSLEGARIHLALIDLLPGPSWRRKGFTREMLAAVPNLRFLVAQCSTNLLPLAL